MLPTASKVLEAISKILRFWNLNLKIFSLCNSKTNKINGDSEKKSN